MKKQQIAFVCNIDPGGITTVISHLAASQSIKKEFELSLFVFKKSSYHSKVQQLKKQMAVDNQGTTTLIKNVFRLTSFLRSYQGAAVVFLGPLQILIARIIKIMFHKKYQIISWLQVSAADPGIGNKIRALKWADQHLAISTGIKDELMHLGIAERKIQLVYNAVPRRERTIRPNPKQCTLVYIGRIFLDGQKNLRGLLTALEKVPGNWELQIFGDGPDFTALQQFIAQSSVLGKRVKLAGWVADPFGELQSANALLLNSNYEGFGLVLAEAMSYGIPCLSTDCPVGPNDIIKDNINGYLYPISDYQQFQQKLATIVNGKKRFVPAEVKASIAFLYDDQYDRRFIQALRRMLSNS